MGQYQVGLFGCFADVKLCILTFLCPCVTVGNVAHNLDSNEDFLLTCLTSLLFGYVPTLRYRVRKHKNIDGTMLMDYLTASFCGCCALIQDAQELSIKGPSSVAEITRT